MVELTASDVILMVKLVVVDILILKEPVVLEMIEFMTSNVAFTVKLDVLILKVSSFRNDRTHDFRCNTCSGTSRF